MTVKAILARKGNDVATISPGATLAQAIDMLAARRIGALIARDGDQRVVGIISERDIVRVLAERGAAALDARVEDVMTRKVTSCTSTMTVSEVMERMTQGKFRHVPVIELGRLIGIVSIGDVVKYRLEQMEREQNALRDYILTA